MVKNDTIYKVKNIKYSIDEYVYILKKIDDTSISFIFDFQNNRYYIEDNYPLELIKEKEKIISKENFYGMYKEILTDNIKESFPDIFQKLSNFKVQKSLF